MRYFILLFFIILLVFTRFYNLDKTSRFIWDESSDLVSIHRIYVDKQITLIGPISEDGTKVFGSLTYYMLLPFAIALKFDPVSTTIGAAFWGVLTGLLFLVLASKLNGKATFLHVVLIIFWSSLLIPARWAWNPNFMPFWAGLAILVLMSKLRFRYFLSGFLITLCMHHHYLALFTVAGFTLYIAYESFKTKTWGNLVNFILGISIAILPFIIFDLRHAPGLFLTRIIYFNNFGSQVSLLSNFNQILAYIVPNTILGIIFLILSGVLIYKDLKSKSIALKYLFIFLFSAIGIALFKEFYGHYILTALPFLFCYLVSKRAGISRGIAKILILIIIISSLGVLPTILNTVSWENNIQATKFIANTIDSEIKNSDLKNINIAVLQSPDPNIYGRRYRDLLLIKNVTLKTKDEYNITDNLFVISYSPIEKVRNDEAYEISRFRSGELVKMWEVPNSSWKMYFLHRN